MFRQLRELSKNVTVYGLGDVAVSIVNFLLLGVYVLKFTSADYGAIGILGGLEVIAKIVFRFGLDGSFMRFFYECETDRERQRLASTLFFFLFALDGAVAAVLILAARPLAASLLDSTAYTTALRLMIVNTFAIGFTFIPFHVLRIERRATTFSMLTLVRSALTIAVRLVLVMKLEMGVTGLYLADCLVTAAVMILLVRWFAPLVRATFSAEVLREALTFGLPRVPHAAAQQVTAVGDKFILGLLTPPLYALETVGVYSLAVTFGLVQKLFLSAFESAWAPFYYATIREVDASRVFSTVTTYGVAILALLTAGLSATGEQALKAITHGRILAPDDPRWSQVGVVIAFTAIGVFFQGVYLLTSIGLNITKQTRYYPVATVAAAIVNVALNFLLIPHYGIVGAAWANGIAYAIQAALGYHFSQRFYPLCYEWGRIVRAVAAGVLAFLIASLLPSIHIVSNPRSTLAPLPDVVVRGLTVILVFAGLLGLTGFFRAEELQRLSSIRRRREPRAATIKTPDSTEMAGEIVATDLEPPE